MLQWMGGSRRKVTTSRQSTQKRQKQYFEQRKRQHQKQQTGGESFIDGTNPSTPHSNNRSLDILSLLNLSTVTKNYNSSSYGAGENLGGGDVVLEGHTLKGHPIIQNAQVTQKDPDEFREEYPSGSQVEVVYRKNVLSCDHNIQIKDLIANDERRGKLTLGNLSGYQPGTKFEKKVVEGQNVESIRDSDRRDKFKIANGQQLSVFDLIGDDGSNGNDKENPSCEAHVAFAMEGLSKLQSLGEMGQETPVNSPEQPVRIFSYGSISPAKAQRQSHFSKNLNQFLYDVEPKAAARTQNTNLPLYGSFLEAPISPEGTYNPFNKAENRSTCKESWQFTNYDGKSKNYFSDDEMFWEVDNGIEDNWTDSDEPINTGPQEDYDMSWKSSPSRMNEMSVDCWNIGIPEASDFTSVGPNVHKTSVAAEKTRKFSISESANPYYKQCRVEEDVDLLASPDGTWSPKVGQQWRFLIEDAGDSFSLRSEESCSSTAGYFNCTQDKSS